MQGGSAQRRGFTFIELNNQEPFTREVQMRNPKLAIAAVAAVHIGAALFHHFVRKDHILTRMISG